MDNQNKIKHQTTVDLLILELEEIRKQINQISGLSRNIVPEFSKQFLLEDLKQYESYILMKLAKETGTMHISRN